MTLSTTLLRSQLAFFKPFLNGCSIETVRAGQEKLGKLMAGRHRSKLCYAPVVFRRFLGEWIAPGNPALDGVILYLHGGGYVAGDIDYARGFGSVLAAKNAVRVFCAAYRLAPEHPFPAALEDALTAYRYLLDIGYSGDRILLCGESSGGGLIYALAMKLRELGLPLPGGLIAVSPWSDLTASGKSYQKNREKDPTMLEARLRYYAERYTVEPENPLVSPLFGDLTGFPPSLLFVGGDEIMLDDAVQLHRKLTACGCRSKLTVTPEMWHGYVLYGVPEAKKDFEAIRRFLVERLSGL